MMHPAAPARVMIAAFLLSFLSLGWPDAAWPTPHPESLKAGLSRNFCGTFQWNGDTGLQDVYIHLGDIWLEDDSRIVALGKGRYITPAQTTYIDVRWLIDLDSNRLEMWELNPSQPGFTIDGSHVGTIVDDLTTVEATWTTQGTGAQGTLLLHTCSSATSAVQDRSKS
jgi:hypothetical protein